MKTTKEIQAVADKIIPDEVKNCTHHAILLFERAYNLYDEQYLKENNLTGNEWVHMTTRYADNCQTAADLYANIPCPASQWLQASTEEELEAKIAQRIQDFQNEEWLKEYLYPYL